MKKNILIIADSLNIGGAENAILTQCMILKEKKIPYILVYSRISALFLPAFLQAEINLKLIERKRKFDINYIAQLRKYIKKSKCDIIHVHFAITAIHIIFAKIALKRDVFFTHHGFINNWTPSGKFKLTAYVNSVVPSYFVAKNLAVTHYHKSHLLKYGVNYRSLSVLYNTYFEQKIIRKPYCPDNYHLNRQITLGMIGNFSNIRDHATVIYALNELSRMNLNFSLKLIGTGNLLNSIKSLVEELELTKRVFLLGSVININTFFSEIDIFIASSRWESFGISLLEGIASATPTIASDIPAYKEITKNGKYAVLFKFSDPIDLKNKILLLLEDKHLLKKLFCNSKECRFFFSNEKFYKNLIQIYKI